MCMRCSLDSEFSLLELITVLTQTECRLTYFLTIILYRFEDGNWLRVVAVISVNPPSPTSVSSCVITALNKLVSRSDEFTKKRN